MLELNNMKSIKLSFLIIIFTLLSLPVFAEEQTLQLNWPTSPGTSRELTADAGIAELVAYLYEWGILVGILIFFGILIYAGLRYLTSAGNPSKMQDAKKRIISGFSGVILLLGSYLILNTINPELTQIREISPSLERVGSHEFTSSMMDDENLCEFSFITVQEDDDYADEETVHFLVPGLARETEEVFPLRSQACVPEKNESEILEVREYTPTSMDDSEEDSYWMLVYRDNGREKEGAENLRVYHENFSNDDLYDLYAERYEEAGSFEIDPDSEFFETLRLARESNNYNLFHPGENCEENIIGNQDFNRPRCLELDDNGNLQEWRRIGYASLTEALSTIVGNGSLDSPDMESCPTAEDMGSNLGYKRDRAGGGCTIAFYDGEEKRWLRDDIVTCSEQISRPSADMNTFDGLVDRETNCLELNRYETPLDIEEETIRHKVEININPSNATEGRVNIFENEKVVASNLRNNSEAILPEGEYSLEWSHTTALTTCTTTPSELKSNDGYILNLENDEVINIEVDCQFTGGGSL